AYRIGEPVVAADFAQPPSIKAERVVPQRIDFDCLAPTRSHDPFADFRVHPCELIALGALTQKSILGIDADAKTRSRQMGVNDLMQLRQDVLKGFAIARDFDVTRERVEE